MAENKRVINGNAIETRTNNKHTLYFAQINTKTNKTAIRTIERQNGEIRTKSEKSDKWKRLTKIDKHLQKVTYIPIIAQIFIQIQTENNVKSV